MFSTPEATRRREKGAGGRFTSVVGLPRSPRSTPAVDAVPPPSSLAEKLLSELFPLDTRRVGFPFVAPTTKFAGSSWRGRLAAVSFRTTLGIRLRRRLSSFGAGKKQGQRVGTSRRTRRDTLAGSLYRVALFFR